MTARLITSSALLLLLSYTGIAQRMDAATSGTIGISYTQVPAQSFKDTSGGLGYHAFGINMTIPLFGSRNKLKENTIKDGRPHFYEIMGYGSFEQLRSTIGFITQQRNFYTASAGLGGLIYNGRKNVLMANLAMGIASDGLAIQANKMQYRFSGSFIVNHIKNTSVMYQYGLVFTYAYGRPLPLPVLGIRKKFAQTWSFSALLPVAVQLTDKLSNEMTIGLSIRPAGNRFQLQNQHDFATSSPTVYMQLRQFEMALVWQYRFAGQFSVGAEAGILGGGKLRFTEPGDRKTILYQTSTRAGAKFRLTLRYHLPRKKAVGNKTEEEILNVN